MSGAQTKRPAPFSEAGLVVVVIVVYTVTEPALPALKNAKNLSEAVIIGQGLSHIPLARTGDHQRDGSSDEHGTHGRMDLLMLDRFYADGQRTRLDSMLLTHGNRHE